MIDWVAQAQQRRQARRAAIGKRQRFFDQRAIRAGRIEIHEHQLVRPATTHLNGEGHSNVVAYERERVLSDPCAKLNAIAFANERQIVNRINPVAEIEPIGIDAVATAQGVMTLPTSKGIRPRAATELIVTGKSHESIGRVCAAQHIGSTRSIDIEPQFDQFLIGQRSVRKCKRLDSRSGKDIVWIEIHNVQLIPESAIPYHQRPQA